MCGIDLVETVSSLPLDAVNALAVFRFGGGRR